MNPAEWFRQQGSCSTTGHVIYRDVVARAKYFSQDRSDVRLTVKELSRHISKPRVRDSQALCKIFKEVDSQQVTLYIEVLLHEPTTIVKTDPTSYMRLKSWVGIYPIQELETPKLLRDWEIKNRKRYVQLRIPSVFCKIPKSLRRATPNTWDSVWLKVTKKGK